MAKAENLRVVGVFRKPLVLIVTGTAAVLAAAVLASVLYFRWQRPCRYSPGERLIYRVEYASYSSMDYGALFSAEGTPRPPVVALTAGEYGTALSGLWIIHVVSVDRKGALLSCILSDHKVSVTAGGAELPDAGDAARKAFMVPFFIGITHRGEVTNVWIDTRVNTAIMSGFIRALASSLQTVLPSRSALSDREWRTEEYDVYGRYAASYRVGPKDLGKDGSLSIVKRKERYFPRETDERGARMPAISTENDIRCRFDTDDGVIRGIVAKEVQELLIGRSLVGRNKLSFSLTLEKRQRASRDDLSRFRDMASRREKDFLRLGLFEPPPEKEMARAAYQNALAGRTPDGLMKELSAAEARRSAGKKEGNAQLYVRFKAIVYLYPEYCRSLASHLKKAPAGSLAMELLPLALSTIGNTSAQQALVDVLMSRKEEKEIVMILIPMLGTTPKPEKQSELLLRELSAHHNDEIARTAWLSLGVMAHSMRKHDRDRSEKIAEDAVWQLKKARTESERAFFLTVLGNIRTRPVHSALVRYAGDNSPRLREEAVLAMRYLKEPKFLKLLIGIFMNDKDEMVRARAAEALMVRPPEKRLFLAMKEQRSDPSVIVRTQIAENLWRLSRDFPEAKELLIDMQINDPSDDVRKFAGDLQARTAPPR